MSELNLAVLGLFHGWRFVECIKKYEVANLVAAADLDPDKLNRLDKNVEKFRDYKELLKKTRGKLDGIIAALPNDLHVEVTEEAAKANIPLMLEKPIACCLEDAGRIIKIVNDSKIKFLVAHHRRFSKRVLRVKEEIDRGTLGRIIGVNVLCAAKKIEEYFLQKWRVTEGSGGVLLINAIHDVDILRYLIGEIEMVQARTTNWSRGLPVEDTGAIVIGFKNGAVATLFITDNSPSPWYYEMYGEEYSYSYSIDYHRIQIFGEKASLMYPQMDLFYYENDPHACGRRPIKQERLTVDNFDVFEEELTHFCQLIKGETESRVTAEDATESLRVIEAIKESSRSGKAIYIEK